MKKQYKRLEIHVKPASVQEKAEFKCVESISYFDKKDVLCINKQTNQIFGKKEIDTVIDNYLIENDIVLYSIEFTLGSKINNIMLSEMELDYLCED